MPLHVPNIHGGQYLL